MEVYHMVTDENAENAKAKLNSILRKGVLAGPDGIVYARPFELPHGFIWASFEVDPRDVSVTNQRLQGQKGYAESAMPLDQYLEKLGMSNNINYLDFLDSFLDKRSSYLPEVRVRQARVEPAKLVRYCDGVKVRRHKRH